MQTALAGVSSDRTKPAREMIIQLFNEATGENMRVEQFRFGVPQRSLHAGYNTDLFLHGQQTLGVVGKTTLRYNRLPANLITEGKANVLFAEGERTMADLLPQINAKFGVCIDRCEIVNQDLPELDPSDQLAEVTVALIFRPEALVWYGDVLFKLRNKGIDLSDAYSDVRSDGFIP